MPHQLPFGRRQWDGHRIYKHTEARSNPPKSYLPHSASPSHTLSSVLGFQAQRNSGSHQDTRRETTFQVRKTRLSFILMSHFMHSHGTRELQAQDYCSRLLCQAHILWLSCSMLAPGLPGILTHENSPAPVRGEAIPLFPLKMSLKR